MSSELSGRITNIPAFYVMEVLERAHELEREGRSIIHLEIGEPDFPTASHICETANAAMCAGETKYTHSLGLPELRDAIANNYKQKFNVDVSPEQIIITSGTSPAMLLVCMALLDQGDQVIMSNPHYACYPNFIRAVGGDPDFVYTNKDNGFVMKAEAVSSKINEKTKAILINSPFLKCKLNPKP